MHPPPRVLGTGREAGPGSVAGRPGPVDDPGHPVCALSYCTLWTQGTSPFCANHRSRWEAVGRPEIEEFIVLCESYGDDRFDFRALAGRAPADAGAAVRAAMPPRRPADQDPCCIGAAGHRARRREPGGIAAGAGRCSGGSSSSTPIMLPGTSRTASSRSCATPSSAWRTSSWAAGGRPSSHADVWELRRLGVEGRKRLRFDGIAQPWLRELAKRFARWRLSMGRSPNPDRHRPPGHHPPGPVPADLDAGD